MRSEVVELGDQVVMVCGFPVGAIRPPNMALLHTVGEERLSSLFETYEPNHCWPALEHEGASEDRPGII